MKKNYLVDAFSIHMLKEFPSLLIVLELPVAELCAQLKLLTDEKNLENALRYSTSARIISLICGLEISKNPHEIKVDRGDSVYTILIKGKPVYPKEIDEKVVDHLLAEKRVRFYRIIV